MKIIFYRGEYPKKFNTETFQGDPVGGTEFAAGYLAKQLAHQHQVFFICQTPEEKEIDHIHWIPLSPQGANSEKEIRIAFQKIGQADILILVGGLSNVLFHHKPLVKRVVCWANGLSLKPNTVEHLLANRIDQIVCTTHYACQTVLHHTIKHFPPLFKMKYFLHPAYRQKIKNKFTFIYNGVNLNLFSEELYRRIAKKPYKILYVGVFNRQKNPDKILKVFYQIQKALPQAELHMCGSIEQYKKEDADKVTGYFDGDEFFAQIKKYIYNQEGRIRDHLYLRGALHPSLLAEEMMSAALVVVNPQIRNQESSCIGALEAQTAGTPVVGGGLSALEETIQDQTTGFVFRRQEELAPLIIRLLKNPANLKEAGKNGRKRALAGFGWETIAKEWEGLFRALLEGIQFIPHKH
ncbi:MAG: glycosyltransferase family 4 protein [Patescibacteria group bacterium]|nr:glycosyltransferase family 4 protein [Patescibacteria group bacterium]